MKLKTLWQALDTEGRDTVAHAAGTKRIYLYQIAFGHRQASPILAQKIEAATGGKVTRQELRPDIYGEPKRRARAA